MGGSAPNYQKSSAEIANEKRMTDLMQRQAQMQEDAQKAAIEAQNQMVYNTQVQAANQAGAQSEDEAKQQLYLQNQYQQAVDSEARKMAQNTAMNAGNSQTGGGTYDFMLAQKQKRENLGMASGLLPQTAANTGFSSQNKNPIQSNLANKTNLANALTGAKNPAQNASQFGGY